MSTEEYKRQSEIVKAQREAFIAGALHHPSPPTWPGDNFYLQKIARSKYPMPKRTEPRIVQAIGGCNYKIIEGRLHRMEPWDDKWSPCGGIPVQDVKIVADLLANPTEEVPGDE